MTRVRDAKPAGTSGGLHLGERNSRQTSQAKYTSESSPSQEIPIEALKVLSKVLVGDQDCDQALILEHFPDAPLGDPDCTLEWLEERPSLLRTVLGLDPSPDEASRGYLTLEDLKDVLSDITWLWKPWLPRGFLTLLAGRPGVGKSTLALVIGGAVVSDRCWPDGQPSPDLGHIVWVETESSTKLNLDRAESFGIPLDRIIVPGQDAEKAVANLRLDRDEDWEKLEKAVQIPGVELVIVDSLRGAFQGDENSSQCAKFLEKLAELAREHDVGLILVHHLRKKGLLDGDKIDIDRVRGSSAIVQVARVVWGVDRPDPQNDQQARMYMVKNNLSPRLDPIGFTRGDHGLSFGDDPTMEAPKSARQQAAEFLLKFLADGPKASKDVKKKAEEREFSESTLNRAKADLGIKSDRVGDHWTMALPSKTGGQDA